MLEAPALRWIHGQFIWAINRWEYWIQSQGALECSVAGWVMLAVSSRTWEAISLQTPFLISEEPSLSSESLLDA